jgi:hypothetical protein
MISHLTISKSSLHFISSIHAREFVIALPLTDDPVRAFAMETLTGRIKCRNESASFRCSVCCLLVAPSGSSESQFSVLVHSFVALFACKQKRHSFLEQVLSDRVFLPAIPTESHVFGSAAGHPMRSVTTPPETG